MSYLKGLKKRREQNESNEPYPEQELTLIKKRITSLKRIMTNELKPLKLTCKELNKLQNNNNNNKELYANNYRKVLDKSFSSMGIAAHNKSFILRQKYIFDKHIGNLKEEKHWNKDMPYNKYCVICKGKNNYYGSLLYEDNTKLVKVNWPRLIYMDGQYNFNM